MSKQATLAILLFAVCGVGGALSAIAGFVANDKTQMAFGIAMMGSGYMLGRTLLQ